ncbi:uncharacterized protein LOC121414184 [Lytechinus variegatus]|uniref:uncharacterized protein LOC121414184 n=1 Tax=Lytechinus variegatus TaxID=7654 RepID=UPI001BB16442|nr:uncharacterized protein LOC121414184 [Lytechinus variegatus]
MGSKMSRNSRHSSIHDRINAAKDLVALDKTHSCCLTEDISDTNRMRVVVDTMDNTFTSRFDAFPDRAFIIRNEQVAYIGSDIMDQMEHPERLMTDEIRVWLKENKENI